MKEQTFALEMAVRDYECDLQGIVNNSVYMSYLEHTRHEFFREHGLDWAAAVRDGINLIVVRAELDYLSPLRAGDRFLVELTMKRESLIRFLFLQKIVRLPSRSPVLSARILQTSIDAKGRPHLHDRLAGVLAAIEAKQIEAKQ